jgi:hypothetical protein
MTTDKRKHGRPPLGVIPRDAQVAFFLREEDAQWWAKTADELGFKSRSQLFTALAERLKVGGLAPITFLKLGMMIAGRAKETGASKSAGYVNPFQSLPPLPLVDEPADEEIIKALHNIERDLKAA